PATPLETPTSDSIFRAHHGYGPLILNLGRNNSPWRLGCRRDDRCRLAFGLDAHGTTSRHSRTDQPLWVGSGGQDHVGIPFSPKQSLADLIRPPGRHWPLALRPRHPRVVKYPGYPASE